MALLIGGLAPHFPCIATAHFFSLSGYVPEKLSVRILPCELCIPVNVGGWECPGFCKKRKGMVDNVYICSQLPLGEWFIDHICSSTFRVARLADRPPPHQITFPSIIHRYTAVTAAMHKVLPVGKRYYTSLSRSPKCDYKECTNAYYVRKSRAQNCSPRSVVCVQRGINPGLYKRPPACDGMHIPFPVHSLLAQIASQNGSKKSSTYGWISFLPARAIAKRPGKKCKNPAPME